MASDEHHQDVNKQLVSSPEIQATATETTLNKEGKDEQQWYQKITHFIKFILDKLTEDQVKWMSEARGQLIVVATIITTITFQIAVNPPGGVYQASFTDLNNPGTFDNVTATKHCQGSLFSHYHKKCQIPGNAVFGYSNPVKFGWLTVFNTGAFMGSLCITFILACGFSLNNSAVLFGFNVAVGFTLESLMFTFLLALDLTNPMLRRTGLGMFAMALLLLAFTIFHIIVLLNLIVMNKWNLTLPRYSQLAKPFKKFIPSFLLPPKKGTNRPPV